jgi:hypothetical protein
MYSVYDDWTWLQPDCSIRKSMAQCLLTAPHSLSQLVASFIGSQCQGIPLALFVAWPCVFSWFFKIVDFINKINNKTYFSRFICFYFIQFSMYTATNCFITLQFQFELVCHGFCFLQTFKHTTSSACANLLYVFCEASSVKTDSSCGGLKWTRTTDLTLIRRAL